LENRFASRALFTGSKAGTELVDLLSACDVYVFPSKTDTFSLTIIEALACGLPVAAYDVQGPKNILTNGVDGYIGEDLRSNALKCLDLDRENCARSAERYSWQHATDRFVQAQVPVR
jgi:glycosyltransferase involved in cell wall biosynthesis